MIIPILLLKQGVPPAPETTMNPPPRFEQDQNTSDNYVLFDVDVSLDDNPSSPSHCSEPRSEDLRSDTNLPSRDDLTDEDSYSTTEQLHRAAEEARSAIDSSNIMASTRYRKQNPYLTSVPSAARSTTQIS